ncbi:Retrotransposon Polyprotein [Phytophthora megakarya]|uniref:Retrotransposon Polyprotein n=1 Tax=Phytophthora megakarya TaxID=4795 RepID=A0A225WNG9_9STRA|nr:Retrotransposon Polyprotein [Phytophthora megakarya]
MPNYLDLVIAIHREPGATALEGCDSSAEVELSAYTDADWGTLDDRRSVSGTMIMTRGAPVIFKSKYQRKVALSSAEA